MDYNKLEKINVTISNKEYTLFLMKTEEEKEYGAKGIKSLNDNEGFLFDYRDNPQDEISFWMEDTNIPLDVIFVDDSDTITKVYKGEPRSKEFLTGNNVSYVIEVKQNSGIKKGDDVDFNEEFEPNSMFVLNNDGTVQFKLEGAERIFSRIFSRKLIRLSKNAKKLKTDKAYKSIGRALFRELDAQTNREEQFVDLPK